MKKRISELKRSLLINSVPERIQASQAIPVEDTTNIEGAPAYSISDELYLLTMLNTLKIDEDQYYRSVEDTMKELQQLIEKLATNGEAFFVAQAIIYSRCIRDGMKAINHLAAAILCPFIIKQPWARRFYSSWNKKSQSGGCIYRADDMAEIQVIYKALGGSSLAGSMKRGFAKAIESFDTYTLAKYKKAIINIANLAHPSPKKSKATITLDDGTVMKTLDAIMKGITVSADTWEVAQSEAGQEVAKAVKEGKLDEKEAEKVLKEAKAENWADLLYNNKLGILAAIRNIRNILLTVTDMSVIDKLCALISNGEVIKSGKIMPYQLDYAYEVVKREFRQAKAVMDALIKGYEAAIPNLAEALPGKTCIFVDCSGSMRMDCVSGNKFNKFNFATTAAEKAGLIAATIAKAVNADVIRFGNQAEFFSYDPNDSVFSLGRQIGKTNMGGTSISAPFALITENRKVYDRIIILSDNECNEPYEGNWVSTALKKYIRKVADPYIYAVDLAAYGTACVKGPKISYYFGYGTSLFEDIANKEFDPTKVIDEVRKIVI